MNARDDFLRFLVNYKKDAMDNFSFSVSSKKKDHFIDTVVSAIESDKEIFIWGDYDVDGIVSTAFMVELIKDFAEVMKLKEPNIRFHIPSRWDGYGIKKIDFDALAGNSGLIICLDNGTHSEFFSSLSTEEKAKLLVVDHHPNGVFDDQISVINPNSDGSVKICTGVLVESIFSHMRASYSEYNEQRGEDHFRDLSAITLISDVASLNNEEIRKKVTSGLRKISGRERAVYKILFPEYKGNPGVTSLSFDLIPVINSIGRMSDSPSWAVDLIMSKKMTKESRALVSNALLLNNLRKEATDKYTKLLIEKIKTEGKAENLMIHAHHDDSPIGINGIIASNLYNYFRKDVIVTSVNYINGGQVVGSGRGEAVKDQLAAIKAVAEDGSFYFGGHNQAVGIKINDFDAFEQGAKRYNSEQKNKVDEKNKRIFVSDKVLSIEEYGQMCNAYYDFVGGDLKYADSFFAKIEGRFFAKDNYRNGFLKVGLVDKNGNTINLLSKKDESINYISMEYDVYTIGVQPFSLKDLKKTIGTVLLSSDSTIFRSNNIDIGNSTNLKL